MPPIDRTPPAAPPEPTYTITNLSRDHLAVLMAALELFERVGMGQFREVLDTARPKYRLADQSETIERLMSVVRDLLMPELQRSAYFSIHSKSISDNFRVAYDLLQVIRHRVAWDREPEGGIAVSFDAPLQTSFNLPLAEIYSSGSGSAASLSQSGARTSAEATSSSVKAGSKSTKGRRKTLSSGK